MARLGQPGGQRVVGQHSGERLGQRRGILGLGEQGVAVVGGHVVVAGDVGGDHRGAGRHPLEKHHAEALAAEGRRTEHARPGQAGIPLGVADPAQPLDPLVAGIGRLELLGERAGARHPQGDVGGQLLHRLEQDGQALAGLVASDEEDRGPVAGRGHHLAKRLGVDGVVAVSYTHLTIAAVQGPDR